jgi:hypothetical protein
LRQCVISFRETIRDFLVAAAARMSRLATAITG